MHVDRIEDPAAFLDAAGPLLLEDEARHNLMLGLAGTLRDHPEVYPDFGLWLVRDGDEAVGAALRTKPFNLVLARPREETALEALVGAIEDELPGVVGAVPEVEAFAAAWSAKHGVEAERRMGQGVFALGHVSPVSGVDGSMRAARDGDRPLLLEWLRAFGAEALPGDESDDDRLTRIIDHRLSSSEAGFVLWEHGAPVSMAGFGGKTPNGIRVGPVYTPPEHRNHGYASALVAELSTRLLASGRRFCFLYTDLSNPTSNRIYERIGYRRVCDSAEMKFVQAQATK
jgi:ribosomal protein S18 acetylase RimI-like enzyme